MTKKDFNHAVSCAIESCERYRVASERSIVAQKTISDLQILNEMLISHREEVLALYHNNRETRNTLFRHANEILEIATSNGDIQLAEMASIYINQAHSLNPFV